MVWLLGFTYQEILDRPDYRSFHQTVKCLYETTRKAKETINLNPYIMSRTIQDYMTESDKMFFRSFINLPPEDHEFTILDSWKKFKSVVVCEENGDTYWYKQEGLSILYHKWRGSQYEIIAKFTVRV